MGKSWKTGVGVLVVIINNLIWYILSYVEAIHDGHGSFPFLANCQHLSVFEIFVIIMTLYSSMLMEHDLYNYR